MTAPTLCAWSVTLSFAPPGPLHATLILAPTQELALAQATIELMRERGADAPLLAALVGEVPAEVLRSMLRALDGKLPESGSAEVMRLVPTPAETALLHRKPHHVPLFPQEFPRPPGDDGPAAE